MKVSWEDLWSSKSKEWEGKEIFNTQGTNTEVLGVSLVPFVSNFLKSSVGLWQTSEKSENFFSTCDKTQPERGGIKVAEYGRYLALMVTA